MQVGPAAVQLQAHTWVVAQHVDQQRRREQGARCGTEPQPHRAGLPVGQQRGGALELMRLHRDALGARQHHGAERRELVALADAVDELHAELLLEHLDAAAERRLRQVHLLGRAAEGAGFGEREQVVELLEVHGGPLFVIRMRRAHGNDKNNALDRYSCDS
ncbi:hypothetical protein D3C85_1028590 [compost metagenome]